MLQNCIRLRGASFQNMVFKLAGTVMGFLIKSCEIFSFMSLSIGILFNWSFRTSISRSWIYSFSNFSCMFLNPNILSNLNSNCSNSLDMRNPQEQVKKHSLTKNCSDLSLFEKIVLVISKLIFSITRTIFSHSNFGNKYQN